ncbi:MAG: RsiW-degrading membrane proteinase PrsW (M82 family) [Saprospiraceae bacterium]|jgi:RsiW-degrading membrane proteinase PrsW (M82 family)
MNFFNRDSFIFGFLNGIAFPALGFALIKGILYLLSITVDPTYIDWRIRTVALIAICFNFIPFQIQKSKNNDESMRGIVIPTLIFGAIWIYTFWEFIVGQ